MLSRGGDVVLADHGVARRDAMLRRGRDVVVVAGHGKVDVMQCSEGAETWL